MSELNILETDLNLIPPESMIFIGGGDFKEIGDGFFKLFVDYGHLKPEHKVLDIGCGLGRMARPLTQYLANGGEYWGIDIVKDAINWCNEKYSPRYPNFHFQVSDIYNKAYNPLGQYQAAEYKFPYEDASFDFVFLTSVFTHMFLPDVQNYLTEISRMTKSGGITFITFFILETEALINIILNKSSLKFEYELEGGLTISEDIPESAVAYQPELIRSLYNNSHFTIEEPIHYGAWSGRENGLSYQDIIIARKQ